MKKKKINYFIVEVDLYKVDVLVVVGEISRFSLLTIVVQGVGICYFDPPLLFSRINHGELRRLHQHHQQGIQGTGRESHEDVLQHFRGNRNREGIPTAPVCKETA